MYKRSEDGIVLVDRDRCRGWRMCMSGCPYKKVYFSHKTGKAEKCTLCYPRLEVGLPPCARETCVGRLALPGPGALRRRSGVRGRIGGRRRKTCTGNRQILVDPTDPEVIAGARAEGISDSGSRPRSLPGLCADQHV